MAARRASFYLLKAVRISGWLLFFLVPAYIISGYALCGKFGLGGLIGGEQALALHKALDVPLIVLFLAHSLPAMVLAFRRWGWIGRKKQN